MILYILRENDKKFKMEKKKKEGGRQERREAGKSTETETNGNNRGVNAEPI